MGNIRQTGAVAFGQPSGPPASQRQLNELLELLQRAGHSDFRDARGPMGFTQRQAGGKFTAAEAQAFIDELQAAEFAVDQGKSAAAAPERRQSTADRVLATFSDQQLAGELQRRGWIVMEP